jgi:hypothetical protein
MRVAQIRGFQAALHCGLSALVFKARDLVGGIDPACKIAGLVLMLCGIVTTWFAPAAPFTVVLYIWKSHHPPRAEPGNNEVGTPSGTVSSGSLPGGDVS